MYTLYTSKNQPFGDRLEKHTLALMGDETADRGVRTAPAVHYTIADKIVYNSSST